MPAQTLRDRAAQAAAAATGDESSTLSAAYDIADDQEPLPTVEVPEAIGPDADVVPVHIALARLMRDIGVIAKRDKFSGGNAGNYNFRGIDRVVNAVAPLMRKHGLLCLPEVVNAEYRDVARQGGGRSHECLVTVRWHWVGPGGDELVVTTRGEAMDTSDKATAKAQSVAWRVCLIQTLAIATGDPDPDSVRIERGEQPLPKATDYRDEIVDPRTSLGRLRQIRGELQRLNMGGATATNEAGDEETLWDMAGRIGRERTAAGDPS